MSVTYFVNDEDDRLAGIFTLTHKAIDIPAEGMSNAQRKKIQRFAQLDQETGVFRASAYLIAQFGKNYAVGNGMSIRGTELMECTELATISHCIGHNCALFRALKPHTAFVMDNRLI